MRRESESSGGAPGNTSSPAEPPTADTAVFRVRWSRAEIWNHIVLPALIVPMALLIFSPKL